MAISAGPTQCLLGITVSYILWRLVVLLKAYRSHIPYPPGPPGLPLLGNLSAPSELAHVTYRDWSLKYGSDVVRIHTLGFNTIILNSLDSAIDLLDKRSSIYSDRPTSQLAMWNELVGFGWSFASQAYGSEWRDGRKVVHREFRAETVKKYRPVEVKEVHKLLRRLLQTPEHFMSHAKTLVVGEIISIAYGIEVQEENDPYIITAEKVSEAAAKILRYGTYLVDFIPMLKHIPEWFPGAGFKREARIWRKSVMDLRDRPFDVFQNRIKDLDQVPDCAAKSLMNDVVPVAHDAAYMERIVKGAMASMYFAGSDTTLSIIWSFFLTMVLYPDVQREAQRSIDQVCDGRLPDFGDYDALPYVHAIVKECLRWNPVASMNLAHRCMEDNVYKGSLIPAGSVVFANIWAMMHDPEVYPNPEEFKPSRFLKRSTSGASEFVLDPSVRDPVDVTFGFGRRICPGRYMAYDSLWLTMVSVLAVFDISPSKNENGEPMMPTGEYDHGFVCRPKPFTCEIKPRSTFHENLILEMS